MAAVAEDKGKLGELVAFQIVRGTRWMDEYSALTVNVIEGWRRDKKVTADDHEIAASTEELAEAERVFLTDTYRLTRMMIHGRKLATVLASMHWTLVEFISPVVATSDHPVVFWPADVPSRVPQATPLSVGIINCSEIRLPLSPRHVVLMTWTDDPDDEPARVRGTRSHAASINAFTGEAGGSPMVPLAANGPADRGGKSPSDR